MRTELPKLIALAERLLASDEPGILATLFSAQGSSYRSLGSMMVSGPPGTTAGGVSGGCLEEYIVRHGREATRECGAVVMSFETGNADDVHDAKPVLGCGGTVDILIERLTHDHLQYLRELAEAYARDVASLATCMIQPMNDGVIVSRKWGYPESDLQLIDAANQAWCDRRSYSVAGPGDRRTFIQYVPPVTRLVIFGAGEDVRPVCDLGQSLGWHVSVADRRARLARAANFPSADLVIAAPWDEAVEQLRITPNTAIVLMTHSLIDDADLLPLLAEKPFVYAGVLGPVHRREALLTLVSETHSLNDDFIARLRGPIGLDLGDRSPAGIAVAVISEIMTQINERRGGAMSQLAFDDNASRTAAHV